MTPSAPSSTVEFVDEVSRSIQATLDALFLHESELAQQPAATITPERTRSHSFGQLETTIADWQAILDSMGDQVRIAQESLAMLDADLNRSLGMFAAARKHLQGEAEIESKA